MTFNITNATTSVAHTLTFGAIDYASFTLLLLISAAVGVYFGFFSGENNTADEYLLGGKRMKPWPIAISLVSSSLSAASVITVPAEIYAYGFNFAMIGFGMIFVTPILCYIIIPVFYNNNIVNCYEYLELRFNKGTRQIVTFFFVATAFLILPIYTFIPALAFAQVTGFNIHLINLTVCSICIFYTMFGGIKAVVWTDVIQATVMIVTITIVAVIGLHVVGGWGNLFQRTYDGGRFDLDWSLDPRARSSVFNCLIAGICLWTKNVGLNQTCVQRVSSLPSFKDAKKALIIFSILFVIVASINFLTGLLIYAKYYDCDPIAAGVVERADKIVPFFVQDIVGNLKGMPGVFISCVFSAALGSMSAIMNTLAGVCYFDYVKPFITHNERKANLIMKIIVLLTGMLCVLGGLLVENSKSILQSIITVTGITYGTIFGVFLLGLLVPKSHGKPALIGLTAATVLMVGLVAGAYFRMRSGKLVYKPLPTRIDGCDNYNVTQYSSIFTRNFTHTAFTTTEFNDEFSIFDISFNLYKIIGASLVWIIAIPLSYIIPNDKKLNPKLLAPIIASLFKYEAVKTDEDCECELKEKEIKQ